MMQPERRPVHHPAPPVPGSEDERLEPPRRLQHPGQSLHHDAAGGDPRPGPAVHPDRASRTPTSSGWATSTSSTTSAAAALTSITSYTHRDILVVRDAGALTASITGGSIGLPAERLHPQRAAGRRHQGQRIHPGAAPVGQDEDLQLAGRARSTPHRIATTARTCWSAASRQLRHSHPGHRAPKDVLFFSNLRYKLEQFALFSEGTWSVTDASRADRRPALLPFQRGSHPDLRRHLRPERHRQCPGVAAGQHQGRRRGAARHGQLRRGQGHQAELPGLQGLPAGRHQRPAQRPAVHAPDLQHVRRPSHLEGRDAVELRGGLEVEDHGRPRLVQRRRVLHGHHATCRRR